MILSDVQQCSVKVSLVCVLILRTVVICDKIDAHISFAIEGEGFPRFLSYEINFDDLIEECYVSIYLELPSALYVSVDELYNLRRLGIITACSTGETDTELFTEKAKTQNITICSPLIDTQCVMKLPIYPRYQYASENNEYVNITVPKPKLLLGCRRRINEYRVSKIDLCSPCVELVPKWREIPYVMLHRTKDTGDACTIPVGNTTLLLIVTYITLSLTILCTIYLIRTIWRSMPKQRQKEE